MLAAAKEFNIGKDTLLEYLVNKGFEINGSNPNTKLTEQMYNALQAEFAQDKLAKRRSEEIALPKGSLLEGIRKTKEDLDITVKDKKAEEPVQEKKEEKPKEPVVAKPAPQPEVKAEPQPEVKPVEVKVEAPAPPKQEVVVPPPVEAVKPVEEKVVAPAPAPVVEEVPKVEAIKETHIPKVQEAPKAEESTEPEHVEIKAPKLEGPNILGKINLEELNLASRPKKGTPVKKKEDIKPAPAPKAAAEEQQPAPDTEKTVQETPAVAAKTEAPAAPVVESNDTDNDVDPNKPEHIEMKAPRLEGPKIIGRIELPVSGSGAGKGGDSREKRKRKRIVVEKKPENFKPGEQQSQGQGNNRDRNHPGGGNNNTGAPGQRPNNNNNNRDNRDNRGGGGGYQGNRPAGDRQMPQRPGGNQGGGYQGNRPGGGHGGDRRGGGNDRRGNQRNAPAPVSAQQQEIDTKAIQEKIRETQAKLTGATRGRNLKAKYRRNKRDEMNEKRAAAENAEQGNVIQVTEFISVSELANLLDVSFAEVISKCMSLGIMVSINQRLDAEVIELVSSEFGYNVEFINLEQETEEDETEEDDPEGQIPRAPIVTIMGHVDHGKTSLLDYIRSANVVAGESGGITQHIGAYQVVTSTGKRITFLDTPGHEAFTAMRARGAKVADIAVIVVAADDAIMPQTKEAISHAQAASLPMIFAINKIDKVGADPERIKQQLASMNILVEDWGGKFQSQEISAKKGTNVELLLEKIGLEAEMLELKANPDRLAVGSVIEASLDKGRGYQATILVQTGTLEQGDMIVCGQYFGKVKAMFNERGQRVNNAGPSTPVQVLGLNGAPQAGEKFKVYTDEDEAKDLANHRAQIMREQGIRARKHITLDEIGRRLALGNFKELGIIIKGDFDGSVEALSDSLQKLSTQEVAVNIVHKGVGQITESDVLLATASDAIILGFQVRPSSQAARLAEQENIEIRTYSIIYDAIEEIKSAMEGLLEPKIEKKTVCNIEVREVFKISGVGTIAGCYVLDGKMTRNTRLNIIRDGIVIYNGELASLKRFKDDVKDVNAGYECGLMVKNYNDVRIGDIIEGYDEVEVKRTL